MTSVAGTFAPSALRVARGLAAVTQSDLARRLDIKPQYVQQLESGARTPNVPTIQSLALALGVEPAFLFCPVPRVASPATAFFRSLAGTPVRERERVEQRVDLLYVLVRRLCEEIVFPRLELPRVTPDSVAAVESAAIVARRALGILDGRPVPSVVRAVERAGLLVADIEATHRSIDAFSVRGDPTILVRCLGKGSTSRERFDLAHELGHQVMHDAGGEFNQQREDEADQFASAFLFPTEAFLREFPRGESGRWARLFALKLKWGMSVSAIVFRARQLGLIDDEEQRRLWIRISRAGWRRGAEPDEPPRERSELIPLAFREIYRARGVTPAEIAAELGWSEVTLRRAVGPFVADDLQSIGGGVVLRQAPLQTTWSKSRTGGGFA